MKKQRIKSLLLALVVLVTSIPMTMLAAEEETLPTYNAYNEYTTTQNPNGVWTYQYRSDKTVSTTDESSYKNMVQEVTNGTPSTVTMKNSNTETLSALIIKPTNNAFNTSSTTEALRLEARNNNAESILTFTAPYSGTISLNMANGGVYTNGAGIYGFTVLHNGTEVSGTRVGSLRTGEANFTGPIEMTVNKGDTIRFAVELVGTYTSGVVTLLNPQIVYSEVVEEEPLPTYNAYNEYSVEKNPNGVWTYQYRSDKTVSTTDESSYKNMVREVTNGTPSDVTIKNSNTEALVALMIKSENAFSTSSTGGALRLEPRATGAEAVLTFTAPYSGTISLSMANGGVYTNGAGKYGFTILHNGTEVSGTRVESLRTGEANFSGPVVLSIEEGDTVRFVVDSASAYQSGVVTLVNPQIAYTKVVKDVLPTYNAYNEYSVTQNPNGVWTYQYRSDKTVSTTDESSYKNMVQEVTNGTPSNVTIKNSNTEALVALMIKSENTFSTSSTGGALRLEPRATGGEAVLTFTAPYSGTISLSMANGGVYTNGAGIYGFTVLHNGAEVSGRRVESLRTGEANFSGPVALSVEEGDTVRFVVDSASAYQNGVVTLVNPEITYTNISYNAYNEYSVEKNPNGVWTYQYRSDDTVVTTDETSYKNMVREVTNGTPSDVTIKNSNTEALVALMIKSENAFSTSSTGGALRLEPRATGGEAVLTFTAPYSGTISISMANGGVYTNGAGIYGFTVLHNGAEVSGTRVESLRTGETNFSGPIKIEVDKYDTVRFVVDLYGSYASGIVTLLNPEISYTKVDAVQPALGTYYISSSEGKDTNNGLSAETPWKSLSKLADIELVEGNAIYLKAGDTWNEQFVLNNVSGTKENPVLISTYGDGMATLDLQLVEDESTNTSELAVPVVLLNNAEGVEISNLSVTGSGIGMDLHYENSFNNEYVKISNCTFTGLKGFRQATASETERERGSEDRYYTAGAICTTVTNNTVGITDPALIGLYIDNCTSNDCGTFYTTNQSPYFLNESGALAVHGFYMTACTMTGNDYYGTIIGGIKGGYMDGCIIKGCGDDTDFKPGTAGIMISAADFAIINTEVSEQKRGGQVYDGVAVDLEQSCNNVTVSNCYFHDNAGAGMLIYDSGKEGTDGANVECEVTNCYFEDNLTSATGSTSPSDPYADIRIESEQGYSLMNSKIMNNQFINSNSEYEFCCEDQSLWFQVTSGVQPNNTIKDNISVETISFVKDATLSAAFDETFGSYNKSDYIAESKNYVGKTIILEEAIKAVYKFTDGYSSTEDGVWRYQYYDISGTKAWQSLTYDTEWKYGVSGVISKSSSTGEGIVNPNTMGTIAIGFCAPQSGRIRIEMARDFYLRQANKDGDGVYISVLNGDMKLVCEPIDLKASGSFSAEFPEVYVDVKKDECIYICVSKKSDTKYDSTRVEPIINYVYTFDTINEEEGLDVKDVVRLKKYMKDKNVTADAYNADLNGDGLYDDKDASILRKYLVGGATNTLN